MAVFLVVLAAALAGLFGGGPLSRAAMSRAGISLEYDRFLRTRGHFVLQVIPDTDALTVRIKGLFDPEDAVLATPHPESEQVLASVRTLCFAASPGEPMTISLEWKPQRPGLRRGGIEAGEAALDIWVLAYP